MFYILLVDLEVDRIFFWIIILILIFYMSVVINSYLVRDSLEIFDEFLKYGKNLLEDFKKNWYF